MTKTNREQKPVVTVDDFDKRYFPEYFQKLQKEKDFDDSEKRDGEALIQVLFSV